MTVYKNAIALGLLPEGTEVTFESATSITYRIEDTRYYFDVMRQCFYDQHQHCNKGHSKNAAARAGVIWKDGYRTRGLGYVYIYYTDRAKLRDYYREYAQICLEARHSEPAPKPAPTPRVKKAAKPVKNFRCFIEGMPEFAEQIVPATSYQKAKEIYEKATGETYGRIFWTSHACFCVKAKEIK